MSGCHQHAVLSEAGKQLFAVQGTWQLLGHGGREEAKRKQCACRCWRVRIVSHALCLLRRRRPFLIRPLENTLIKLLRSLDFYDEAGRTKIAMGAALDIDAI